MKIKFKIMIAIFAVLAIALLQYYYITNIRNHSIHLDEVALNTAKYEGEELVLEGIIDSIDENTFIIRGPSYNIKIYNANEELKEGQHGEFFLKVEGGKIVCKDYRIYKYHYTEYLVSFLGVIIVVIVLLKELKLTKGGFDYA